MSKANMNKLLRRVGIVFLLVQGLEAGVALAEDNYGAIATGSDKAWGYAYDYSTRAQAEAAALQQCQKNAQDCEVRVWFQNACGAVAESDARIGWGWGESREIAERNAISGCQDNSCKIITWACTSR
jgi:Domain of unknown function (DUF4189)